MQTETDRKNAATSASEVAAFKANPPEKYFPYINETEKTATTWTGDRLGSCLFGREWRDNFGGIRVPVEIRAINGHRYHGTYYKSSGDYARVTRFKS